MRKERLMKRKETVQMEWYDGVLYIYAFILGCCVGSFINVAVLRTVKGDSFIHGRSHCPDCGSTLRAWDLIPVFSFLLLRGRCRYCKVRISARYPLTELSCGLLCMVCYWRFGLTMQLLVALLLLFLLLCVFLIDMDSMTIPNGLVLCFLVPAGLALCAAGMDGFVWRLWGMAAVSAPMLLLALLIPDCFGGGDIKLMAVCGFILGLGPVVLAFFLAVVSCGAVCAVLLLSGKSKRGEHIAFGPYLACGVLIAYLFYEPIMTGYLSLFA